MDATNRPADIPAGHLHRSEVLARGWTRELLQSELSDCRVRTEAQIDACTSPVWYPAAAVEAAEAGDAFRAHRAVIEAAEQKRRESAGAKRAAAAPAVAERNAQIAALDPELVERRGRRLYIRCGYESQLGVALRNIGAKWDRDERCLWIGTGKAAALPPLLAAEKLEKAQRAAGEAEKRTQHRERMEKVAEVQDLGLWITIPYRHECGIRARAKALGAVWNPGRSEFDPQRKRWAMPDRDSYEEVAALLRAQAEREEAKKAERKADDQLAEKDRRARVVEASGRTPTGETANHRIVSTRRMSRAEAEDMTHPLGTVIQLDDGRSGVVVETAVWFTNGDDASSTCWHPETHDEAHWDLLHVVAIVEPTTVELAHDAARRAAQRSHAYCRSPFHLVDLRGEPSPMAGILYYDEDAGIHRPWDEAVND
jgi:hypothetical protein